MTWQKEIKGAVQGGQPIVLDLAFDPGWADLRLEFEQKASEQVTPRYVSQCLKAASHRFDFESTAEFLAISKRVRGYDPKALDRLYIHFQNDVRRFDQFVVGANGGRFVGLQKSFHISANGISSLPRYERNGFVDALEQEDEGKNDRRASAFPRLFYFRPSKDTRNGGKGEAGLLLNTGVPQAYRKKIGDEGNFVGLMAADVKDSDLREMITTGRGRKAIIATPYLHRDKIEASIESVVVDKDPSDKFGLVQMKVFDKKQICTNIPPGLDFDPEI